MEVIVTGLLRSNQRDTDNFDQAGCPTALFGCQVANLGLSTSQQTMLANGFDVVLRSVLRTRTRLAQGLSLCSAPTSRHSTFIYRMND